jgi:hypothetical protein
MFSILRRKAVHAPGHAKTNLKQPCPLVLHFNTYPDMVGQPCPLVLHFNTYPDVVGQPVVCDPFRYILFCFSYISSAPRCMSVLCVYGSATTVHIFRQPIGGIEIRIYQLSSIEASEELPRREYVVSSTL